MSRPNQAAMPQETPSAKGRASRGRTGIGPVEWSTATAAVQGAIRVGSSAVMVKPSAKLRLLPRVSRTCSTDGSRGSGAGRSPGRMGTRVYPVHRLDAEVTGLLVFACDPDAQRQTSAWFEGRLVHKDYFAWTEIGDPPPVPSPDPLRWECLLAWGKRRAYEHPVAGKPSLTLAWLLEEQPTSAGQVLGWRLQPHTGRSHQLRYELARHGWPILGVTLYGAKVPWPPGGIALRAVSRLDAVPPGERLGLPVRVELPGLDWP